MLTRTSQSLEKFCKDMCARRGHDFNIPIKISGRLTVTVCKFIIDSTGKSTELQLSRKLIDYGSEETLIATLIHQSAVYCYYMENAKDKSVLDDIYADLCVDEYAKYGNKIIPDSPKMWKYTVKCPECGRMRGETKRTDIVMNAEHYMCSCGHVGLEVIQNW